MSIHRPRDLSVSFPTITKLKGKALGWELHEVWKTMKLKVKLLCLATQFFSLISWGEIEWWNFASFWTAHSPRLCSVSYSLLASKCQTNLFLLIFQRTIVEAGNKFRSICLQMLSGVGSTVLHVCCWTSLCARDFHVLYFVRCMIQIAVEFMVGALRPRAAVPAAGTATLYPRQVTAQDKAQLCWHPTSQRASASLEENCQLCQQIIHLHFQSYWEDAERFIFSWCCVMVWFRTTS